MRYALHYGFEVTSGWQPPRDIEVPLPLLWPFRGFQAFVSGSFKCWGPADQDTDGDDTLHVVVYSNFEDRDHVESVRDAVQAALAHAGVGTSRIAAYGGDGIVTEAEDWSVVL